MKERIRVAIVYDGETLAECGLCALLRDASGAGLASGEIAERVREALVKSCAAEEADIVDERCIIADEASAQERASLELARHRIDPVEAEGASGTAVAIEALDLARNGIDAIAIVGPPDRYRALVDALHRRSVRTCTAAWRDTQRPSVRGRAHVHITLCEHGPTPRQDSAHHGEGHGTGGSIAKLIGGRGARGEHPYDYGFIEVDGHGSNAPGLFFHRSNLAAGVDVHSLRVGVRVGFVQARNERGPCAANVRLEGAAVKTAQT